MLHPYTIFIMTYYVSVSVVVVVVVVVVAAATPPPHGVSATTNHSH
jgi:hypothetical protein